MYKVPKAPRIKAYIRGTGGYIAQLDHSDEFRWYQIAIQERNKNQGKPSSNPTATLRKATSFEFPESWKTAIANEH